MSKLTITLIAAALFPVAQAAGTVEVRFIEPARYSDAGRGELEIERTTQDLERFIRRLGRRLPDGQSLRIDVLDVDLAGELRPLFRGRDDVRLMRGGADWPRMTLRYTLTGADGRTLQSGEETISDMNYQRSNLRVRVDSDPLAYDHRLLERWFDERFVPRQAAVR